jgi:aspartate dehydrogenase
MRRRVGLIGCGTIGSELAVAIDSGKIKNAFLVALFDEVKHAADSLKSRLHNSQPMVFTTFKQFSSSPCFIESDVIVEAASQQAVRNFANSIVAAGKELIIMSVGALVDDVLLSDLLQSASVHGSSIYLPSGAVGGIDAIRSTRHLTDSLTLTTTKNPKSFIGIPGFKTGKNDSGLPREKIVIFEGPASEAVKKFPLNVNVAGLLSLAGIGFEKTRVKMIADPSTQVNQHQIVAKGIFGEIIVTVNNVPSENNPKTSYLAVLSAIETLNSICNPDIRIGT